MDGNIFIPT